MGKRQTIVGMLSLPLAAPAYQDKIHAAPAYTHGLVRLGVFGSFEFGVGVYWFTNNV